MTGMSLLDVLRGVMLDPAEQAVYEADPGAYLRQHGYEDVDPADLSEAFGLVADTLPAEQAMAAYTGSEVAGVSSIGADTTDFDEPPAAPGEGGLADDLGVYGEPADIDDIDHMDDIDDGGEAGRGHEDLGRHADAADQVDEITGHFGEGEDTHVSHEDEMDVYGVEFNVSPGDDATGIPDDVTTSDVDGGGWTADEFAENLEDGLTDDPGAGSLHSHDADDPTGTGTGADDPGADIGDDPDELDIGSF